jgi:hypothetical protein
MQLVALRMWVLWDYPFCGADPLCRTPWKGLKGVRYGEAKAEDVPGGVQA